MNRGHKLGLLNELKVSKEIHSKFIPLLVHPKVLRKLGAGQVDIAYFEKVHGEVLIKLVEVKSSMRISTKQSYRLRASAKVISSYFDLACQTSVLFCCLLKY